MTSFPRISTTTIGRNKDAPRVWLEGRYLLDAGFEPTNRIQVHFKKGQVIIRLAKDGTRVVSSKRHGQIPVLDLNNSALTEAFGPITTLQVHIGVGQITLTPSHTEILRATRCRNGKEGSIYSGGGLLTEAARLAGYQPAFAIEVNPQYADVYEKNHNAQMFNVSVENAPIDALPPVELLTLGIPCEPYSTARTKDKVTGAKRDRSLPPEAHALSDLTIWAALIIRKLNPATVVLEQAPGYLTSGAGYMMLHFLKRAGYTVEARVLDPRDYGELTGRRRSVIVAHSGSNYQWPQPSRATHIFADIRDDESTLRDQYFTAITKPWLVNHWNTQIAKGNGFASAQLSDESTSVPCISKRYMAGQGTGAVVKNKTHENCWRWLTLNEIRKLHQIPDSYQLSDTSKTLSGEIIGQGVIVSFFQKIIEATRSLSKIQEHIQNTIPTQPQSSQPISPSITPQLGFSFS
jgi:DNA (cytosine-5)-methyltransferase 1